MTTATLKLGEHSATVRVGDVVPMTDGTTRFFHRWHTGARLLLLMEAGNDEPWLYRLDGTCQSFVGPPAIDIAALAARQSAAPPAGAEGALAERLEALAKKATPGPWTLRMGRMVAHVLGGDHGVCAITTTGFKGTTAEERKTFAERALADAQLIYMLGAELPTILRALRSDAGRAVALTADQVERIDATTQQLASAWNMQAWNEHCDALRDAGLIDRAAMAPLGGE